MDKNYNYKHTKGFIVFILLACLLLLSTAYGQVVDSYTSNLVNGTSTANSSTSTWQGVGLLNGGLPCWAPGDPGYCGPNAYANGNSLNFSYGLTDAHQYVNISKSLPYSGTGLVTTGFVFSWMSKNGNNWEPTTNLDVLSAYVSLYDKGNKQVEYFYWDLNYIHNWTTFTYNKNWSKEYRPNEVSNARFGFVGMDTSYWAGPYGPEVANINFQVKFKPDPCVKNQLYSPECPQFTETLEKITTVNVTTETSPSSQTYTSTTTLTSTSTDKMLPKEEQPNTFNPEKLESTLIKIFDNQQKQEQTSLDIATDAVKETNKVATQTVRQAERIAKQSVDKSIELGNNNTTLQNKNNDAMSYLLPPIQNTIGFQLPSANSSVFTLQHENISNNVNNPLLENISLQKNMDKSSMISNTSPKFEIESNSYSFNILNNQSVNISQSVNQNSVLNVLQGQIVENTIIQNNFLTNKTNPINEILDRKPIIENNSNDIKTDLVKKNVQDNELANGVDINKMAVNPQGYNVYLQLALRDVAFYAPKEIYRNQKVVDNNRALRQLASDRLHEEMVNQQYRR